VSMNGRFTRLEFNEESRRDAETRAVEVFGTPIRTAAHDLGLAVAAYRTGDFERALRMYTHSLQLERSQIAAWVGQVQMLVELGEYNEARLWSDKALELFRNNGDLLAVKATACLRAGDGRAAHECSDASLASPGSSPVRWRGRGEVILNKAAGRARDCFEKSLAEPQADWFDRVAIARVYLFHRQPAAAAQYAQAAVEIEAGHAYCWYVRGRCQESLGWTDRASESYARAVQLAPDLRLAGDALRALERSSVLARIRNWFGGLLSR